MIVRPAEPEDATQIAYIYNHYVATSHATFELDPIDAGEMLRRLSESLSHGLPFLVCDADDEILGFAFGKPWRPRPAYNRTVEVSIYVKPGRDGRGVGNSLCDRLFLALKEDDLHAIIAGIALPNDPSVRLHEKFGFEKVAHFREVGRKFDRWIDVGYWELIFRK